jgi:hypothetical protein
MDSGSIAEEQAGNQSRVLGHLRTKEQPLRGRHNFEQGGNRTVVVAEVVERPDKMGRAQEQGEQGTDYLDQEQPEHRNQMRPMEQEVLQQGLEQGPHQRNRASWLRRFVEKHWILHRELLQFLPTTF